jgi:molybdopterin converting factor small subunit
LVDDAGGAGEVAAGGGAEAAREVTAGDGGGGNGRVRVRYFAAARAAAGVAEETVPVHGGSLAWLIVELTERHGQRLAKVVAAASFLVNGLTWHDREMALPVGATVDVLPPFAGG